MAARRSDWICAFKVTRAHRIVASRDRLSGAKTYRKARPGEIFLGHEAVVLAHDDLEKVALLHGDCLIAFGVRPPPEHGGNGATSTAEYADAHGREVRAFEALEAEIKQQKIDKSTAASVAAEKAAAAAAAAAAGSVGALVELHGAGGSKVWANVTIGDWEANCADLKADPNKTDQLSAEQVVSIFGEDHGLPKTLANGCWLVFRNGGFQIHNIKPKASR